MSIACPADKTPAPDPRGAWLSHFPGPRRGPVANWFHAAVRRGAHEPAFVLQAVRQVCDRRQQWGDETDTALVLAALASDPDGARAYAESIIAYEALPLDARRRVKAERTFAHLKGKEVTPAQMAFLEALGYQGTAPEDRAAASALIDRLQQGRVL